MRHFLFSVWRSFVMNDPAMLVDSKGGAGAASQARPIAGQKAGRTKMRSKTVCKAFRPEKADPRPSPELGLG